MSRLIAPDYGQQFIFPPALEDWVASDHPVRFLREFVDECDLGTMGFVMPAAVEGRPVYAPSLLLKIWLYGYYFRIRSTRKLEAACVELVPLRWLCGLLAPDHNTLWRFWSENKKPMRALFKQTVKLALNTGCVGLALQAVDGTKIPACASGYSGWSKKYMEKVLAALDATLEQTELKIVEENKEASTPTVRLPAGLAQRQVLREEIKKGLAQLAADERKHYHPVEPEARRMKVQDTNRFAYNAQAVADAQEGIIVACEATRQETDVGQLVPMIKQARENLGLENTAETITVADTGYGTGADLQAAGDQGLPVLAPPFGDNEKDDHPYATKYFSVDLTAGTATCPQKRTLDYEGKTTKKGQVVQRFRCHHRDCPVRAQCTSDPKGRQIEVWPHHAAVQAMRAQLKQKSAQQLFAQRCHTIEPRFAQLKQHDGFRRWTVWGLESVQAQWALLCTTLNLRILFKRWQSKRRPLQAAAAVNQAISHSAGSQMVKSLLLSGVRRLSNLPWLQKLFHPTQLCFATT
jgi:transposase